jgi:hypothetical protein
MTVIVSIISFIVRYIGWPTLLLGLLYIYEEGLPGVASVPHFVTIASYVPIVGDLAVGRVHIYANQQVKLAEARCDVAKAQMVTRFERDTLAAQLQLERQRVAEAQQVADNFRKRYTEIAESNRINEEQAEKAIAEDNLKEDGAARVTRDDLDWLQLRHN